MDQEYECLVSVLVTTYNHEKYIAQCLDGMVSQKTDFPFEIIVRDDCSTDGTGDIIRAYTQKYPGLVIPFILEFNHFNRSNAVTILVQESSVNIHTAHIINDKRDLTLFLL